MKLIDLKVSEYLEILSSNAPAPGGGSASALAGAQGAALLAMVCKLTLGKEKFIDYQEINEEIKNDALKLSAALIEAIDEDTVAFLMVAGAYKLPRSTDEEKEIRSGAIQEASIAAIEIPLSVMRRAHEGLYLILKLKGKTNPSADSDLGVAALNFFMSVSGAWLNVKINLPAISDEEKAEDYRQEGQKIYDSAKTTWEGLKWLNS